jgi:hypothetical protein
MNATDPRIILVVIFAMLLAYVIGHVHGVLARRHEAAPTTNRETLSRWLFGRLDPMRGYMRWESLPRDLQESYRIAAEDLLDDWRRLR